MRTEIDLDGWWQRWFDRRDPVARDRLIVHYSPLVKFVAGRVGAGLPNSVDPGDLVSAGFSASSMRSSASIPSVG